MADGAKPFRFTAKQTQARELIAGPARHILLVGGARSGKTFVGCKAVAARGLKAPDSRHALLRFRFNHAKSAIWHDTFPKMMKLCYPGVSYVANKSDWFYTLPSRGAGTKCEIWIGGIDDKDRADKVLGQEYATILLSEASQVPFSSRETVRTRLAQNVGLINKMIYDENPTFKSHWTYKLWMEHRQAESPFDPLVNPEDYAFLKMNPEDNRENLPEGFIEKELMTLGVRQRLRFYQGEFGDATEGSLWSVENLTKFRGWREGMSYETLQRIVVAVDPSGTKGDEEQGSNEVGIVVVGLGLDGHAYVLEDATVSAPPAVWGGIVVSAYERHGADIVVGEINFGGAMVEATIQAAAKERQMRVKYKEVHASRGKVVRAEPISTLYDSGKVHHVGPFPALEDQLLAFTTHGFMGSLSPDRADALVWALTEIFPGMVKQRAKNPTVEVQSVSGPNYDAITGRYG